MSPIFPIPLYDPIPVPANPPVNATYQLVFTLAQVLPAAIIIGLAIRWAVKEKNVSYVRFFLGAGLAALIEPVVDFNGLVWFPTEGQWSVYEAYGVKQPLWLVTAYIWFFGGQALLAWRNFAKKIEAGTPITASAVWTAAGLIFAADVVLEFAGLYTDMFSYYGELPFSIGRWPLWAGAVNTAIPITLVTVLLAYRNFLVGWRGWLAVVIAPMIQGAVNAGTCWPLYVSLHSRMPRWAIWTFGGAPTILLCVLAIYLCQVALGKMRSPKWASEFQPIP